MSPRERLLLKRVASAYVFILDLRKLAISRIDPVLIAKTAGIEESITEIEKLYPRLFRRYLAQIVKNVAETT